MAWPEYRLYRHKNDKADSQTRKNTDGTIAFGFDNDNEFNYVPAMYMQMCQGFDYGSNCHLIYLPGTGKTNHIIQVLSDNFSALQGQGYVGQPGMKISGWPRALCRGFGRFHSERKSDA